jgi:hypothetical protein
MNKLNKEEFELKQFRTSIRGYLFCIVVLLSMILMTLSFRL